MYRAIVLALSLLIGIVHTASNEGGAGNVATETDVITKTDVVSGTDLFLKNTITTVSPRYMKAHHELTKQMKNPRVQPMDYWDKVAQCETGGNWKDRGNYSGGLGIATQTWEGYGGKQFARTPAQATRYEQIIVANRISVLGFQTKNVFLTLDDRLNNRPYFRPAAGFYGWGCIKTNDYLKPHTRHHKHTKKP